MVEYSELETIEIDTINRLLVECKPFQPSSYIRFYKSEIDNLIAVNISYHSDRIINFLLSNDFIKLFNHVPTYELLEEGKRLLKYGTIQKYHEKMKPEITAPLIIGDNNVVNVSAGNIDQRGITITVADNRLSIDETVTQTSIINVVEGAKKSNHSYFHHFLFTIKLNGKNLSAQAILRKLNEYNNNAYKRERLIIINDRYRITANSNKITYKMPLYEAGTKSHFKEFVFILGPNTIQFEYAQYKSDDLLTDMAQEVLPLVILLFFCRTLIPNPEIDIDITVRISTNGKLYFIPNGRNVISVDHWYASTYKLNQDSHSFTIKFNDLENSTIMDLMQGIIEGFCAELPSSPKPFLHIDEANQKLVFDYLKPYLT